MVGGGRLEMHILFLSRTDDRMEFHSNPIQSIPFHSIPCFTQCRIINLEISEYSSYEYHGHFENKNEIKIEHFKHTLLVLFLIPTVMCVPLGCVTLVEVCGVVIC